MLPRHLDILALVLLIASAAWMSGCRPEIDCQDLGCAYGYVCDAPSGQCQRLQQRCADDTQCDDGDVCDVARGACRPEQRRCTEIQPCPTGQTCNGQSGYCQAEPRCTLDGCPSHEVCDGITERCVPRPCDDDVVCATGYVCDLGQCAAGCRPGSDSAGCPGGEVCLPRSDSTIGQCLARCAEDEDCPAGQRCGEVDGGAQCVPEPPCDEDQQCRGDEVCRAQICVAPPCSGDQDCADGLVCHGSTGACIGGDCAEDFAGRDDTRPPNYRQLDAYPVAPNQKYTDLRLCAGREDWFSVTVRSSHVIRVRVGSVDDEADLDLHVYDAAGRLLAADETLARASSVKFASERNQTVYMRISTADIASIDYDLEITTEFCADDVYEENDRLSEARTVPTSPGLQTQLRLASCGFDEDWFRLADLDGGNGIQLGVAQGPADLILTLLTPDGAVFAVEDSLRIARLGVSGDHYLHATTRLGQSGEYHVDLLVLAPFDCPEPGSHVGPTQALPITAEAAAMELLCPLVNAWEVDWFVLDVDTEGMLEASVVPPAAPGLQAALLEEGPDGLSPLRTAQRDAHGNLRLAARVDPARTYFLRISTNEAVGRMIDEPEYLVTYEITPSDP